MLPSIRFCSADVRPVLVNGSFNANDGALRRAVAVSVPLNNNCIHIPIAKNNGTVGNCPIRGITV